MAYKIEWFSEGWDIFYIIDLDTRAIISREDSIENLSEAMEIYSKRFKNLEIVQALQYKETK